jgi:cyclophilin family peptidyl-prolyl cis-trans isomerase
MELFWEKNKLLIKAVLTAAMLAIVLNYGWRYLEQRETDNRWGGFATSSGLDTVYAEGGSQKVLLENLDPANPQMFNAFAQFYYGSAQAELITRLASTFKDADRGELQAYLQGDAKGTPAEPLTLWVLAHHAMANQDWEQAIANLDDLENRFPDHFLVVKSPYPVQYRKEVESEDEDEEAEEVGPAKKPELVAAVAGSEVSRARARIAAEQAFHAEHPELYEAPNPDFDKFVEIEFEGMGAIKIGFYKDESPIHRQRFIELAEAGFWTGQRIHKIARQPEGRDSGQPEEVSFGLVSSKEETVSSWIDSEDLDEGNQLDWELGSLSHFPFMVAAEPHEEGKSQIQRIVINGNDAAQRDGSRVVFGRVVEGMDVLEDILGSELSTDSEESAGQGRPADFITITAVRVVEG